jgi:hypothetical protein
MDAPCKRRLRIVSDSSVPSCLFNLRDIHADSTRESRRQPISDEIAPARGACKVHAKHQRIGVFPAITRPPKVCQSEPTVA